MNWRFTNPFYETAEAPQVSLTGTVAEAYTAFAKAKEARANAKQFLKDAVAVLDLANAADRETSFAYEAARRAFEEALL